MEISQPMTLGLLLTLLRPEIFGQAVTNLKSLGGPASRNAGRGAGNAAPGKAPVLPDRLSHGGSYTPHEVKDYGHYGKNQKNVDEESCDMKDEKSA
jgi:hypothetical protein